MFQKADGQNYAPKGKSVPVCEKGEFPFAVVFPDHGHIYGMCNGLVESGANVELIYDTKPEKVKELQKLYPEARVAKSLQEVLDDDKIKLIASSKIANERADLGILAMEHGKDYFSDKPGMTSLEQVENVRKAVEETGKKYGIYFSERLHVEGSVYAEKLIKDGAIGRVLQVMGCGPHRINIPTRPDWFFNKDQYGGIITDIGCHQVEQIMFFAGAKDAKITLSRTANYNNKEYTSFEDFGEVSLLCDNGASGYFRVDWFTPDGLGAWGDGRTFILGTEGYIEIRKYLDVASSKTGNHVILVNKEGEFHHETDGQCGFPFFGEFIKDCLNRTENAISQEYILKIMEISITAQNIAEKIES